MNIINHPNFKLNLKYIKVVSNFYIYNINFLCHGYRLTSLYGCPRIVRGGDFNCSSNKLKTLKYCPIEIHGDFDCADNQLISLKYCPEYVPGYFDCSDNQLESLEHCPKYVGGNFICGRNKVKFTEEYVRSLCDVEGRVVLD